MLFIFRFSYIIYFHILCTFSWMFRLNSFNINFATYEKVQQGKDNTNLFSSEYFLGQKNDHCMWRQMMFENLEYFVRTKNDHCVCGGR